VTERTTLAVIDSGRSSIAEQRRSARLLLTPSRLTRWARWERLGDMEHTRIGDIELAASRIGLGTWPMGGVQWGGTDDPTSIRTIHAALDVGINVIDTAPAYGNGHSEEVVGRAIAEIGARERVIIATQVGLERSGNGYIRNSTRERIYEEVDRSLARLRTDYIDLYQVHWPDLATPYEETAEALLDLKDVGKIRAIGVSNYPIEALERFVRVAPLAVVQPPLNIFERGVAGILPWCRKRGVGTLTYGTLCRGLLTGTITESSWFPGDDLRNGDPKFQPPRRAQYLAAVERMQHYARDRFDKSLISFAVRWVLDQPGVSVALWGARAPHELELVSDVMSFHLGGEALAFTESVISECITNPIGAEFLAPPERTQHSL
jgi:aryl-alcohol dehydrogenase-like predicted oxidoreductase